VVDSGASRNISRPGARSMEGQGRESGIAEPRPGVLQRRRLACQGRSADVLREGAMAAQQGFEDSRLHKSSWPISGPYGQGQNRNPNAAQENSEEASKTGSPPLYCRAQRILARCQEVVTEPTGRCCRAWRKTDWMQSKSVASGGLYPRSPAEGLTGNAVQEECTKKG